MTKTVKDIKELRKIVKDKYDLSQDEWYEMQKDLLICQQKYENEIIEKDKEISKLKQDVVDLECNQYILELKQLYKEDFEKIIENKSFKYHDEYCDCEYCVKIIIKFKDNSKYDLLASKEEE